MDLEYFLRFEWQFSDCRFDFQRFLIYRLKEPMSENLMDFNCSTNYCIHIILENKRVHIPSLFVLSHSCNFVYLRGEI